MIIEKKEEKPQAPNSNNKPPERSIPKANEKLYEANLESFGAPIAELLKSHPETEIPIDDQVIVQGLKNPHYLVLVGFSGLGVLESARAQKKKISHVLIIEPSLSIFHQTVKREYLGKIAQQENVDLLIGIAPQDMMPHLYKIFTMVDKKGNRAMRCLAPEIVVDPFAYPPQADGKPHPVAKEITDLVIEASRQVFLSMGCASDSFFRWEQLFRNQKALSQSFRIKPLYQKFQNTPAIVIGAGPSLQEFIDAYHEYDLRDRALLIACDASLHKLLHHGIRPHLVTRCERKLSTIFRGIRKEDTKDLFYAAYPWTSPEYFDLFESSFLLFRDNGVCRWSGFDPGSVNGGVSSANCGLEIAFLLGCRQIALTGIDLCFLDGKSHVEGTQVEFDPEKSRSKWTTLLANDGSEQTTIPIWRRCLNEYQGALFKYQGQAEVHNASRRGAQISGAKYRPWNEIAEIFKKESLPEAPLPRLKRHLEKHPPGYELAFQEKRKKAAGYLRQISEELEKLFLNMDDFMLNALREEEKIVRQLKIHTLPPEFFKNIALTKKQLAGIYTEPCRQIDAFKSKFFYEEEFAILLLDICQLDMFQMENRCNSLANLEEMDHERAKFYITLHMNFYRTLQYYCLKMLDLMEKGPNQTVNYPVFEEAPYYLPVQISRSC